jgi:hypothetical protein
MKWEIAYRTSGNPKMYKIEFNGTRGAAECNIYLRHCQGRLEGCPANKMLKIEYIKEIK